MLTTGMAHFWTSVVGCTTTFDWASDKLSHVRVTLFPKKLKIVIGIELPSIECQSRTLPLCQLCSDVYAINLCHSRSQGVNFSKTSVFDLKVQISKLNVVFVKIFFHDADGMCKD